MMAKPKPYSKHRKTMSVCPTFRPGIRHCNLRCLIVNLLLQFIFAYALLTIYKQSPAELPQSCDSCHDTQMLASSNAKSVDDSNSAELQLRFIEDQGSSLATSNHSNEETSAPAWWTLKTVAVADFCKGKRKLDSAGRGFEYTAYTDAILVGRRIYLPASVNCSTVQESMPLRTKFNHGRHSTPSIPVMVVPSISTFDDFSPRAFCHEMVLEPSFLLSFINWPQYGHFMFNGISLLWEVFEESPLKEAGRNVRFYAYGDSLHSHWREKFQQSWPFFDLRGFEPVTSLFSNQPVRSLAWLLKQSEIHPVCFSYLLIGLSGELDHYNFAAPLEKWREFAAAMRFHFQVQETPRLNPETNKDHKFLERLAPKDVLRGNPGLQTLIRPIDYEIVPDRPRLTIIDRHSNRKILNVQNLHRTALETGFFKRVQVVYLEELDISSQIRLMTVTDVLFGMDGTGLMNGLFLPEGGVVVHVRPYGCAKFTPEKGVNFDRLWASNPGRVIRYESGNLNSTKFPTDLPEVPQLAFNLSSPYGYRAAFIMKQDSIIDLKAFRCILEDAHRLLYGVTVDWEKYVACTRTVFF